MSTRPQVICLTPVRNEARFLPNFLAAAETWADAIIVLDQASSDGARSAPGTGLLMPWLNLMPGGTAWVPAAPRPFGLVEDGRGHGAARGRNACSSARFG